jgi:hypothetical protein
MTCCIIVQEPGLWTPITIGGLSNGTDVPTWLFGAHRNIGVSIILGFGDPGRHEERLQALKKSDPYTVLTDAPRSRLWEYQQVGLFGIDGSHEHVTYPRCRGGEDDAFDVDGKTVTVMANAMHPGVVDAVKTTFFKKAGNSTESQVVAALAEAEKVRDVRGPILSATYAVVEPGRGVWQKGVSFSGREPALLVLKEQDFLQSDDESFLQSPSSWFGQKQCEDMMRVLMDVRTAASRGEYGEVVRSWEESKDGIDPLMRNYLDVWAACALIADGRSAYGQSVLRSLPSGYREHLVDIVEPLYLASDSFIPRVEVAIREAVDTAAPTAHVMEPLFAHVERPFGMEW